jgi:antitoxin (DNA-binding transcriptional repressor) of toxin-antitoxin stability system
VRVVNVKELKARLSAYLREADRGETFLVTDRSRVVARLGPPEPPARAGSTGEDLVARLVALGARPPLRARRPTDYRRGGPGPGLPEARIQELLDWVRGERA